MGYRDSRLSRLSKQTRNAHTAQALLDSNKRRTSKQERTDQQHKSTYFREFQLHHRIRNTLSSMAALAACQCPRPLPRNAWTRVIRLIISRRNAEPRLPKSSSTKSYERTKCGSLNENMGFSLMCQASYIDANVPINRSWRP